MKENCAKLRSRAEVMHYVLSFCVANRMSDGRGSWATEAFIPSDQNANSAKPGDLVILTCLRGPTKYIIGWLEDVSFLHGCDNYLIESLEDGDKAWWTNVGMKYFPREKLSPSWRWSDRQWKFKDRWFNVCFKDKNANWERPLFPEFGKGYDVTIGTREKFCEGEASFVKRTFPDWRKVTRAMMATCFDECNAERVARKKEQSEAAPAKAGEEG